MLDNYSQRRELLDELFAHYDQAPFGVTSADGWSWRSPGTEPVACTIHLRTPQALCSLLLAPSETTLGEAYVNGEIDVEGDLFSVFAAAEHILHAAENEGQARHRARRLRAFALPVLRSCSAVAQAARQRLQNTPAQDRQAIAYHYDLPVEFYRAWLGESMVYSCAYFENPTDGLDRAQENKLDLICRKLRLRPAERLLDIGCGWGSLLLHAATRYGAHAYGITLSREQQATAAHRIATAGLEQHCAAELRDYRSAPELPMRFDKIASVGMVEHVGLRNLPRYFEIAHALLKPGGVFLNHGIVRSALSPSRKDSFIRKFVFPNGELVPLSQMLSLAEAAGFEVRDVENLREHYERTLRLWVDGLRRRYPAVLELVSEKVYRIWLLYMAGCAAAFRRGEIAVFQALLSKPDRGRAGLPLTRADWYPPAGAPVAGHAF